MDFSIAGILVIDGLTNGAVYALLGIALVLLFSITRIIFIPQGELVAFSALTLATFQLGKIPGTVWLLLILVGLAVLLDVIDGLRNRRSLPYILQQMFRTVILPLSAALFSIWFAPTNPALWIQVLLTLALIVPFGSLIYRLAYKNLADASILTLLIVSIGIHFTLTGLGLFFFGPEGFRNPNFSDASFSIGSLFITGQAAIIMGTSVALILLLRLFFLKTLYGKALRATAVNQLGAKLVGIKTEKAGSLAFTMATLIAGLSGLLIGPTITMFYDSGFSIGLKGFVVAIFAGLSSFPLAALGAVVVGLIEAFSQFWISSFKEVIVFSFILPILLWRSLREPHIEED